MSYVDLMSDVRWSEADHVDRVEADLRTKVTHTREHVMVRRCIALIFYILAQMLPDGALKTMVAAFGRPIAPAAIDELTAAAAAFLAADDLAAEARADGARLNGALDYEEARAALAALPPAPTDGSEDPEAARRAELQAALDGVSSEVLALVQQRDAGRSAASEGEAP